MLDPRGLPLRAAVAFAGCSMPSYDRALWALRSWLDSWSGIRHVTVGMARRGPNRTQDTADVAVVSHTQEATAAPGLAAWRWYRAHHSRISGSFLWLQRGY